MIEGQVKEEGLVRDRSIVGREGGQEGFGGGRGKGELIQSVRQRLYTLRPVIILEREILFPYLR